MNLLNTFQREVVTFPGLGWSFDIDNVAITIGGLKLYWYGILIGAAVLLCIFLGFRHSRKYGMTPDLIVDYCLLTLPVAFLGARLYYVFCEWGTYHVSGDVVATIKNILDFRGGGLAIYGGVLGAIFAIFIMSKIRKIPVSAVVDFAIVYIPLGQAIGRWGNFFNQEAFGTTTTLPWGMKSTQIAHYLSKNCPELDSDMAVHPTFFYESVCTLITFFILLQVRRKSKRPWTTTAVYFILYGIARFFIEGLRTDSLYIGSTGLRISQVLSLILIVIGFALISFGHAFGWEKKPVPERFMKADIRMKEEAKRKKEQRLREYEDSEDVEDRVERLAKSSYTIDDEEESDADDSDESDADVEDESDTDAEAEFETDKENDSEATGEDESDADEEDASETEEENSVSEKDESEDAANDEVEEESGKEENE